MLDTFPWPRCNRKLIRSGEITIEDADFPVFQCDECIVHVKMFDEPIEAALTFAVDAEGKPFDPASDDGHLPD